MPAKNFAHQLDDKNRMRIPAKLREELGNNYGITVGAGGCLYVLPESETIKLKEKFKKINPFDVAKLNPIRSFLAKLSEVTEDNQGRFVLNEDLRNYAHINKNIRVFKGPSYIEIWSEEVFETNFGEVDFTALANIMDDLEDDRT